MNKKIKINSEIYKIFKKSQKFSVKWTSYFQVYDQIFKKYKDKKITFVEVGVANGGSLFVWKKYFSKKSRIIGIDLNPKAKKLRKHGFEIYIGNQTKKEFWNNFYHKVGKIDILLDDGGHKNLQQVSTVHYSLPHIKNDGIIVVEDTHASFIKKEFGNPSKYSFINFCNLIISSIHKRCKVLNKKLNIYSKNIFSIDFYESIVVFNINKNKCWISKSIKNSAKNEWAIDYRDNEYFYKTKKFIYTNFLMLNKNYDGNTPSVIFLSVKLLKKIVRKILYKNFIFQIYENIKLKKIFNAIEKQ